MNASQALAPPSRLPQWIEWCALGEMAGTLLKRPLLSRAPRGDGRRWVLHREPESNGAQRLRGSVLSLVVDEDFL